MSHSDDTSPDLEESPAAPSRRHFMQSTLAGAMLGASGVTGLAPRASAQAQPAKSTFSHYHVPANSETVHWGYFSKKLKPVIEINSGDFVTIETATHHANDDFERNMSVAVDFGITQVVDGNWGVHAVVKKSLFTGGGL